MVATNLQEEEEMVSGQRDVVETGQTQTAKGQVSNVRELTLNGGENLREKRGEIQSLSH